MLLLLLVICWLKRRKLLCMHSFTNIYHILSLIYTKLHTYVCMCIYLYKRMHLSHIQTNISMYIYRDI